MITKKYDKHGKVVWEVLIVYQDGSEPVAFEDEEEAIEFDRKYNNPRVGDKTRPVILDLTVPPVLSLNDRGEVQTTRSVEQYLKETVLSSEMEPGTFYRLNISLEPIGQAYLGSGI